MAYHVLIVDDSQAMHAFVRRVIEISGFDSPACFEGRQRLFAVHSRHMEIRQDGVHPIGAQAIQGFLPGADDFEGRHPRQHRTAAIAGCTRLYHEVADGRAESTVDPTSHAVEAPGGVLVAHSA